MDQIVKHDSPRNSMSMRAKAKKLLQKTDVDKLPSLPHLLLPLLKICYDESLSHDQLAELMHKDPALYIKALACGHRVFVALGVPVA